MVSLEQPYLSRMRCGLRAISHRQLRKYITDVAFHRADGDDESLGDLVIGGPGNDEMQDFQFPLAQRVYQ